LNRCRVYIAGLGVVSAAGAGCDDFAEALRNGRCGVGPLNLFSLLQGDPLPVGQVREKLGNADSGLPRTHLLALEAARQATAETDLPPDAVVIGTTTGGILTTEQLLREEVSDPARYRFHGLDTVAREVARSLNCHGPILTVSTACSSGAAAIALAAAMIRSGRVQTVLAGGVDSLCRLTYFGFHSLQLVDQQGCRPFDADRAGMAVAEGAGMLLLGNASVSGQGGIEVAGAGLSCDAYHPAAPHPEGAGARAAMEQALGSCGAAPEDISYINLHGTGTRENDRAEAAAVCALFADPPPVSSIKGATGHGLAAAGGVEAVAAALCIREGIIPANVGLSVPDPELTLQPTVDVLCRPVKAVLSNSFGFGGNNAALVLAEPGRFAAKGGQAHGEFFSLSGGCCLCGGGQLEHVLSLLFAGGSVAGRPGDDLVSASLDPRRTRRLKRLPRMVLSLAATALESSGRAQKPDSVFMGTGWGGQSETFDFLDRLTASEEQFPGPTDFVGSVHNGPAGQVALQYGITGANITVSGGDHSFEQALQAAGLLAGEQDTALLIGADEFHDRLTPLLDPSCPQEENRCADGGAAMVIDRDLRAGPVGIRLVFYARAHREDVVAELVAGLGGAGRLHKSCRLVLAGVPAAHRQAGREQARRFMDLAGLDVPLSFYREYLGEFASASAVATVLAAACLEAGRVPPIMAEGRVLTPVQGDSFLLLGLGEYLSAVELVLL
jgi:3-oxoacyl-(acyl-carrier-protein) synthase